MPHKDPEERKAYLKQYHQKNKDRLKQKREENKEKIKEYKNKYREENKEKIKEYDKKRYGENKDSILLQKRQWAQKNKEHVEEYNKKYYQENKEAQSERNKKRYLSNRDKEKQVSREYRNLHKDRYKQLNAQWIANNAEYDRRRKKEYRLANRELILKKQRKWRDNNKGYDKRRYGITYADFLTMITNQHNCCAICNNAFRAERKEPHVDHDHSTGKNRKLLCMHCNMMLGASGDNPVILLNCAWWLLNKCSGVKWVEHFKKRMPLIYQSLKHQQGNMCGICNVSFEGMKERDIHLDHNHRTEMVRGFLCKSCNIALGQSRDDKKILIQAISYLLDYM